MTIAAMDPRIPVPPLVRRFTEAWAKPTASFDGLRLANAVLRSPSEWLGFLRYLRG